MLTRALIIEDEPEGLENLKNLLRMCCPDVDVVAEGGSMPTCSAWLTTEAIGSM